MMTKIALMFFIVKASFSIPQSAADWEQYWSFWSEDDHPVYDADRFLKNNFTATEYFHSYNSK